MTSFENSEELDSANPEVEDDDTFDEGELEVDPKNNVNIEKNDRSLSEFHRWHGQGRLILDSEWQRNYLWDKKRASKLIESFLVDIPVPVIYLAKDEQGKYVVIDGLQRLTSVFNFFDNQYQLSGLEIRSEYEKKKFEELPEEAQYKLQDATLRSFELSSKTSKDLQFVIFERLNTGGVALNRMEIRNCIYRGPLNTLIKNLAQNPDFVRCTNQNGLSQRMRDREFVLRFLAFYEKTYRKCTQGLARFLNDFYETYQNAPDNKLTEFENVFKKTMKACVTVFGENAFRLRSQKGGWSPRINAAVYQAISVTLTSYDLSQITRRADAIYEEYLNLLADDTKWKTCVTSKTAEYQNIQYTFNCWEKRLQQAIDDAEPNDSVRIFSRELKEEMFKQSSVCQLCGNEIKLIDDAALDHEVHYWRGGKTVPDNARLVHRHCNSTRKNHES